jgi:CRISPR/Cas system-associated protein Cas5 (RAMP superfamily)
VLNYYKFNLTAGEIKNLLPRHSYGNTPLELAWFFQRLNLKAKVYLNRSKNFNIKKISSSVRKSNILRIPKDFAKIPSNPIILNIDLRKVRSLKGKSVPHYVVVLKDKKDFLFADSFNYKRIVGKSLEELFWFCDEINNKGDSGLWVEVLRDR